jgi:hypothetical protein
MQDSSSFEVDVRTNPIHIHITFRSLENYLSFEQHGGDKPFSFTQSNTMPAYSLFTKYFSTKVNPFK